MIELLWQDAINRNADRADAMRAEMILAEERREAMEQKQAEEMKRKMIFAGIAAVFLFAVIFFFVAAISQTEAPMHKQAMDTARGLGYLYGI